ncbi:LuxR C-terminal-related transcriptional regulator [Gemmata sp.]|uniref:response regulator transcription factor n=1 Tax=Gemmata sp. TaxID=1914242 RepID=UPI003F705046
MAAGASGYVLKRSAAADLVGAIRHAAAGNTHVDPVVAAQLVVGSGRAGEGAEKPDLSGREIETLKQIAEGYSNKQIAARLDLSVKTVKTYMTRAMEKLGARSRVALVRCAAERGWLAGGWGSSPRARPTHSRPVAARRGCDHRGSIRAPTLDRIDPSGSRSARSAPAGRAGNLFRTCVRCASGLTSARLPERLAAVCLKCLARDPATRYQDAEALAHDLRVALGMRPPKRRGMIVLTVAAFAVLLCVTGWDYFTRQPAPEPRPTAAERSGAECVFSVGGKVNDACRTGDLAEP